MDVASLADLLHETSERHGSFEAIAPPHNWWDWYAAYMNARQGGSDSERGHRGRRPLHGGGQAGGGLAMSASDLERLWGSASSSRPPITELRSGPARTRSWAVRSRSSRRERIPSLANTLRRCHSTVRGLRKSRAPISGFDSPSRASRAIWRSCAVSSSRVSTVRLRTFSPVASSSRSGALGERLHADRRELVVGGAELHAGVDAAILPAQPLAVEQVGAGELGAQSCAAEPLDRLAVQALGGLAVAQQRTGARPYAEGPVGGCDGSGRRDALMRHARQLRPVAPGRGFEQLDRRPHRDEQLRRVVARRPARPPSPPRSGRDR